ncbi:SSS family solute:Na+ symporter [Crossiella equi]|uniref:SSS family solute:Na+ symporter n=1 Tax=Crossiella equi TaxID=130796 RepID=A0ABS5ATZ6_9PSEU|nr:sodium:solute symporter family protein [Crossiella equi]MBP2479170.1 SSS family solute:Na+ symporter [Crossiella equi]
MGVTAWLVLGGYFGVMVAIGWWSRRRVRSAADFFTAGGGLPWWLAGISHHMSGYSAAVFVAYAALAYTTGFAVYVWWAVSITLACVVGAFVFAPRWPRLRERLGVVSPLEYLAVRYDVRSQQVLAWSGTALKVFDVAAKWAASAILLQAFTGLALPLGILLVGGVTMVYSTIGGLWADALTDFGQFAIQLVAGIALLVAVLWRLGGVEAAVTLWDRLPPSHSEPFAGSLTVPFFLAYCLINLLSYNGGTWNLAQRFLAAPSGSAARRSALLSAGLYLVWPLVLFFPMWAAPVLLPGAEPEQSYGLLVFELLPDGLVGLVLAGMFAHTMAMTSSDANAISSVVVRDIVPALTGARLVGPAELFAGRVATFLFIAASMGIALTADGFGGVLGLLVLWFGALVGPVAVPMLLGMLPAFRRCGPSAVVLSWLAGVVVFTVNRYVLDDRLTIAAPVLASLFCYVLVGVLRPWHNRDSDELLAAIRK